MVRVRSLEVHLRGHARSFPEARRLQRALQTEAWRPDVRRGPSDVLATTHAVHDAAPSNHDHRGLREEERGCAAGCIAKADTVVIFVWIEIKNV